MNEHDSLFHRAERKPRLLDLFCCQGGASKGYVDAGFDVVGVDIDPQPKYPFRFLQRDAIRFLRVLTTYWSMDGLGLHDFDAIHASPPCQGYSNAQRIQGREHDRLIAATRELLEQTGLPYVIENVVGARDELRDPVLLCGTMVGIPQYRHRLFETNWPLEQPDHPEHVARQVKMGRRAQPGEFIQVVGNFSGVAEAREAMGMPWANRDGLREAIPPAYSRWVGERLLDHIHSSKELAHAA